MTHSQLPPRDSGTVHAIRWDEVAPASILLRAAQLSLMPSVLVLALLGGLATQAGWSLLFFHNTSDDPSPALHFNSLSRPPLPWESWSVGHATSIGSPETSRNDAVASSGNLDPSASRSMWVGPFLRGWAWLVQPHFEAARSNDYSSALRHAAGIAWAVAVWSLFGAAIVRVIASRLTRGTPVSTRDALRDAASKWFSSVAAPLIVAVILMLAIGTMDLARRLLQFDLVLMLAGCGWILFLGLGAVVLVLAGGLTLGWPMMIASSAVEHGDAFDQLGRAFAYLYQRPFHLAGYVAIATLSGVVCELTVWAVVESTLATTERAMGGRRDARGVATQALEGKSVAVSTAWKLGKPGRMGVAGIRFWRSALTALATNFPLAFFWSAAAAIYLLLRMDVDGVELDEWPDEATPSTV